MTIPCLCLCNCAFTTWFGVADNDVVATNVAHVDYLYDAFDALVATLVVLVATNVDVVVFVVVVADVIVVFSNKTYMIMTKLCLEVG